MSLRSGAERPLMTRPLDSSSSRRRLTPAGIALLYAAFSIVWIVLSGALLILPIDDPVLRGRIEVGTGLWFIAVTSGLLYLLIKQRQNAPSGFVEVVGSAGLKELPHAKLHWRILGLVILTAMVPLAGVLVVKVHGPEVEREAFENLDAIAALKSSQVQNWLDERYNDGEVISSMPGLVQQVAELQTPGGDRLLDEVRTRLLSVTEALKYDAVSLLDPTGTPLMGLGSSPVVSPQVLALLPTVFASERTQSSDVYAGPEGRLHLDFVVPLLSFDRGKHIPVGAVVLHDVPAHFLFPYVQRGPTASASGETLLVRLEEGSVVFMNELRHRPGNGLSLRVPLSSSGLPDSAAGLAGMAGCPGRIRSNDYRGVPVFGACQPVAGTRWILIAKIDRDEAMASLHYLAFWVTLIALLASCAVLVGVFMYWRQRRRAFDLEVQLHSDTLLQQFYSLPFIGLSMTSPTTKQWLQCNDRMSEILGYPRKELFQRTWAEITHPDDLEADVSRFDAMMRGENNGYTLDKRFIRKNGEIVFTTLDVRCVRNAEGAPEYAIATVQDITERKQAEARIQRLAHLYAALSECNQSIVRCSSSEALFPQVCRLAVEFGGMKMAWVGLIDPETQQVKPVASFGDATNYLQDVVISADPEIAAGRGATGTAIREIRPVWIQDYMSDPMTAIWHERAARAGWNSVGALPLTCNDVVVGALTLLSGEVFAFDEAARDLLVEMALDISFALTLFAKEEERQRTVTALRDSESRFRDLYEKAPLAYQSLDIEGNILEVNEAWLTLLGRNRDDVVGHFIGDYLTDVSITTLQNEFPRFQQRGRVDGPVFQFKHADGSQRLLLVNGQISRDKEGSFLRTHCIMTDLTERMKADEQLRLSAKVFEQSAEGVIITDPERRILTVNRAFTTMTGYSFDEVVGKNPRMLTSGHHEGNFFEAVWDTVHREGYWQGEIWNRHKGGEVYPVLASFSQVFDDEGTVSHYIDIFSDISEHKASQEHIQRLAHYDSLTGLPNRSLLADRVTQALSRMERDDDTLAMVFLDLDRFKNVNDSLGHRVGDELLIQVAERLKSCLREGDTVSRLGGDEFILVLPSTSAEGAAHVAEKILNALSHSYRIEMHELTITPSMGIALYPADGETYDSLTMCADTAMYRAKQAGRNTYRFFTREMQERSDRTLQLENALRRVLELDQLQLHYQPQMSITDDRVIGVEALLRWSHPDLGTVSPNDFIPVAEDSGLILPIGEWVLRTAIRQMKAWMKAGLPPMVMAVNLSAIQFRQANLPDLVTRILDEYDLPPQCLELELTEGVAMDNPLAAIDIMNALHERGIHLSIDDFGTGYSSLSYLKRFKVYKLKIDQSFVRDISRDPDDEAIVKAIIGLSRSLGMKTIAEGVETAEQLAFLREKGCDEVQGYFFARPMPAEQLEAFVRGYGSSNERRTVSRAPHA